jgi:predicted RND superfamily exporter protein
MPPFKVFGLFTVLGIFYSWLLTLIFAGSMLTIWKPKVAGYLSRKRSLRVHSEQDVITRSLVAIGQKVLSMPMLMVSLLLVIIGVSGAGLGKLFVNSSWLSDFKEGSEVALSTALINERFDGTIFLNIVVEGEEKDALKSPELLRKIDSLQEYAETLPYVGGSLSVVDYLKSLNKTLNAMDEQYNVLPATRAEIAEALYLYSVSGQPELLDEVVDFDYRRANITVSIKTDETMHLRNIIDKIDAYVDEHFSDQKVDVNYAGSANNSYVWADLLIDSQAMALVFSKVAILLLAIVLFKSFIVGIAVVVPVVLSTLIVGGMAGWLGIPMDVSTALAAGIAIGVGVDYAVHYVFRYIEERKSGVDHSTAVDETMRSVGRTIVFNAVIVSVGFAVLLLSQFPPHAKLGVFVVLYMMLSCIVALFVLPLVLGRSMPDSVFQKAQ